MLDRLTLDPELVVLKPCPTVGVGGSRHGRQGPGTSKGPWNPKAVMEIVPSLTTQGPWARDLLQELVSGKKCVESLKC